MQPKAKPKTRKIINGHLRHVCNGRPCKPATCRPVGRITLHRQRSLYVQTTLYTLQLAVLHGSISAAVWQSLPLPQRQRLHMRGITTVHTFGGNVAPFGLPQFVQHAVYNTGMWAHA